MPTTNLTKEETTGKVLKLFMVIKMARGVSWQTIIMSPPLKTE